MKKFIRIKVQFPVQSQDFSEFSCLVHTYNSISKHTLGRGSQMPSNHCMLTCIKVQPPDSYWLTVIQKRPITNRKHPHWVEQLAECDTRVRSAPRPRGRWGICCCTTVQQQIPQTSWSVGYLSLDRGTTTDTPDLVVGGVSVVGLWDKRRPFITSPNSRTVRDRGLAGRGMSYCMSYCISVLL